MDAGRIARIVKGTCARYKVLRDEVNARKATRADRDTTADLFGGALEALRDAGAPGAWPADALRPLIRALLTDVGPIMIRKAPRKTDGDDVRVLLRRVAWHLGSGSAWLGTPIMDSLAVGAERFDHLDTVALWFVTCGRGRLPEGHDATWHRAIYGS